MITTRWKALPFLTLTLVASSHAAEPQFFGLGRLPYTDPAYSIATGISADGTTIVGYSGNNDGSDGFRWTAGTGIQALGAGPFGGALGVSGNGSVIVGFENSGPFRWTESGGRQGLGGLPSGFTNSYMQGISADGTVIVGRLENGSGRQAARWTQSGGYQALGDLPGGGVDSFATGTSGDGSVIVGRGTSDFGIQAFRWTGPGSMSSAGLGDLPGGVYHSAAFGVSADGSVVVGESVSSMGTEAFRWTEGVGMVGLGDLPGGGFASFAYAVSPNGRVVVGQSETADGARAFFWTPEGGMQDLQKFLTHEGLATQLTGWTLEQALGVTVIDGATYITGYGYNPDGNAEAFLAVVPEPSTMAALGLGALALLRRRARRAR